MSPSIPRSPSPAHSQSDVLDFSDLEEKYRVRMPEAFDNIVVVDNLPVVDDSKRQKLLDVLTTKILGKEAGVALADPESVIHMPKDQATGKTYG